MLAEIEKLMQTGDWEEAMVQCQAMLQVQPVNAKLNAYLGLCHFRKNQFAEAAVSFRKAVLLDPQFKDAGIKLAQCLDRLMQYKEGLAVAKEFLRMYPNDHTLQALVNGLQRQHGAEEEESWQKSIKTNFHMVRMAQD